LVEGFETPFGLELLATVHWVVQEEGATRTQEVQEATYALGPRKDRFSPGQIALAEDRLRSLGWIG